MILRGGSRRLWTKEVELFPHFFPGLCAKLATCDMLTQYCTIQAHAQADKLKEQMDPFMPEITHVKCVDSHRS